MSYHAPCFPPPPWPGAPITLAGSPSKYREFSVTPQQGKSLRSLIELLQKFEISHGIRRITMNRISGTRLYLVEVYYR